VIYIDSWRSFIDVVLSPRYANWAFRGHGDARWALESTLARRFKIAGIDQRAWITQESRILRIFKRKAHLFLDHIPDDRDSFRWLALMQHHGAPTRLLDFTWSPYVAAFFALENAIGESAIWAVSPPALSEPLSLTIKGKRRKVDPERLGPWYEGNYERYFLGNKYSFINYGEPHIMNQRLIAQSGTFVIPSTLLAPVDEILNSYPEPKRVLVKFILATSKLRETAMLELYSMNISYYTLFPGLDGLARSLAYESEYHWAFNPRTMERKSGYEHSNRPRRRVPDPSAPLVE
jgi:hypothetical protein